MTATSIQRIVTPALRTCGNITPAGAIGTAIILMVVADPIGFRNRLFDSFDKFIDARYSVIIDEGRRVIEVNPR